MFSWGFDNIYCIVRASHYFTLSFPSPHKVSKIYVDSDLYLLVYVRYYNNHISKYWDCYNIILGTRGIKILNSFPNTTSGIVGSLGMEGRGLVEEYSKFLHVHSVFISNYRVFLGNSQKLKDYYTAHKAFPSLVHFQRHLSLVDIVV